MFEKERPAAWNLLFFEELLVSSAAALGGSKPWTIKVKIDGQTVEVWGADETSAPFEWTQYISAYTIGTPTYADGGFGLEAVRIA